MIDIGEAFELNGLGFATTVGHICRYLLAHVCTKPLVDISGHNNSHPTSFPLLNSHLFIYLYTHTLLNLYNIYFKKPIMTKCKTPNSL